MAKTPRLPINHNKNGPEYHDASLDPEIIAEFVRRFPRLRFHSFQRNGIGGPQPSHMVRFICDQTELLAVGVPLHGMKAAMKNGFAHVAGEWMLTRDDRRKPGLLEAQTWVLNGIPTDHPMAWLEPRRWPPQSTRLPWLDEAAEDAMRVMGPSASVAERKCLLGRLQRPVTWATVGDLVVIPNWLGIRSAVEAARGAA